MAKTQIVSESKSSHKSSRKLNRKHFILFIIVFLFILFVCTFYIFYIKDYANKNTLPVKINAQNEEQKQTLENLNNLYINKPSSNAATDVKSRYYDDVARYSNKLGSADMVVAIYGDNIDEALSLIDPSDLDWAVDYYIDSGNKDIANKIIEKQINLMQDYLKQAPQADKPYIQKQIGVLQAKKEQL